MSSLHWWFDALLLSTCVWALWSRQGWKKVAHHGLKALGDLAEQKRQDKPKWDAVMQELDKTLDMAKDLSESTRRAMSEDLDARFDFRSWPTDIVNAPPIKDGDQLKAMQYFEEEGCDLSRIATWVKPDGPVGGWWAPKA